MKLASRNDGRAARLKMRGRDASSGRGRDKRVLRRLGEVVGRWLRRVLERRAASRSLNERGESIQRGLKLVNRGRPSP